MASNAKIGSDRGNYSKLTQEDLAISLTAPDPEDVAKPTASVPVMEIVAPATLMEGYELETKMGDRVVKVKIPPGGVAKGQTFTVPVPANVSPTSTAPAANKERYQVPIGHWKDGLCDCCQYGCCHASCCWGFSGLWCLRLQELFCFCLAWPALGATQVATRLNLDWLGRPSDNQSLQRGQTSACTKFAFITIFFVAFQIAMLCILGFIIEDASRHPVNNSNVPYHSENSWGNYQGTKSPSIHYDTYQHNNDPMPVAEQIVLWIYGSCNIAYFVLCIVVIFNVR